MPRRAPRTLGVQKKERKNIYRSTVSPRESHTKVVRGKLVNTRDTDVSRTGEIYDAQTWTHGVRCPIDKSGRSNFRPFADFLAHSVWKPPSRRLNGRSVVGHSGEPELTRPHNFCRELELTSQLSGRLSAILEFSYRDWRLDFRNALKKKCFTYRIFFDKKKNMSYYFFLSSLRLEKILYWIRWNLVLSAYFLNDEVTERKFIVRYKFKKTWKQYVIFGLAWRYGESWRKADVRKKKFCTSRIIFITF